MDLPTLILSDDEEVIETGTVLEATTREHETEGTDNVEVVAYSSPSSPSSSSSGTEALTPSAPRRGGKGLMGLGGLLDAKAIAPEAFKPTSFESSAGEVDDAKKIFNTFVLPELEIPLGQKPSKELLDASDVAIAKALLLSRAQRKQAEKSEARAWSAHAQIDMLQKRTKKAEGQKRELSRRARDAESRLEQLEKELGTLRSEKQIAEDEVNCLR
ncbi:uncharacterized protein LOC133888669 [Phragmites australis]|uniref:uncharacterized protein LOC133888669 n=1 Tax=Phragmites australis TaxID=29695 RepID=UPI002D791BC8|nr:uncharacterized protein LOC133888669 [Phragmites australis]